MTTTMRLMTMKQNPKAERSALEISLVRTLMDQHLCSGAGISLFTLRRLHVHDVLSWLRPSIMYLCHKQPKGKEPRQQLLFPRSTLQLEWERSKKGLRIL